MEAKQQILKIIADETGFPFVATSLQKILSLTGREATGSKELVDALLDHIALCERLLKVANSVSVSRGGPQVATINGAVLIAGFDTVRSISTVLMALEGFERYGHRSRWLPEFTVALLASQVARQMAAHSSFGVAEECATAALFRGVGRVLAAAAAPEDVDQVRDESAHRALSQEAASRERLGMAYAEITQRALRAWELPEILQRRVALYQTAGKSRTDPWSDDWIQGMSSFAYALAETSRYSPEQREQRLHRVQEEYRSYAPTSIDTTHEVLSTALQEVHRIMSVAGLDASTSDVPADAEAAAEPNAEASGAFPDAAVSAPISQAICLTNAVGEMAAVMSKAPSLEKIVPIVLESIVRGLGAKRSFFVLPNRAFATYEARFAHGAPQETMNHFRLDATHETTLFHVALTTGNDVFISDTQDPKVRAKLPAWYLNHFRDVKSFSIMPLSADKNARALIYVDYGDREADMPGQDVIQALRALKQQTQLAMHLVAGKG